ncbi:hypothetical protein ACFZAD_37765 [Streptomyces iakyrus]|uniref:hypothetical protein n=1 Tax=Streptomyces iakyrus TaxID=68219 RepID=UPI0036E7767F
MASQLYLMQRQSMTHSAKEAVQSGILCFPGLGEIGAVIPNEQPYVAARDVNHLCPARCTPLITTPASVALSQRTEFFVHYDGGSLITRTGHAIMRAIEAEHLSNGWSGVGYKAPRTRASPDRVVPTPMRPATRSPSTA